MRKKNQDTIFFHIFSSLSGLKLNEKPAGVVVSSPDGPVFLTPADLTSSSVQPVVTSADGTPGFATDFTTFEAPRTISYQDTQYRPENELYCTSGEFANQRIATNSDGHFVPYQYKVAPGPLTNHSVINSPDSGIGELNNASKYIVILLFFIKTVHEGRIFICGFCDYRIKIVFN